MTENKTIKDEINGVRFTVRVCKHNISILECDECFGNKELQKAKIVDTTKKWWEFWK